MIAGRRGSIAVLRAYRGDWFAAQQALRDWYDTELGRQLHAEVVRRIEALTGDLYALRCLQIGGTLRDADLLSGHNLVCRIHVTGDGRDDLQAVPSSLPFASNSIDLVLLGHVLEFCDDPHGLLREIDRVLTLDGYVLVVAFNPLSLFGLRRLLGPRHIPWSGSFYSGGRIGDWLRVLGLLVRRRETCWLRPPVRAGRGRRLLAGMEWLSPVLRGCGGVQLVLGRKQSIPLTPIPVRRALAEKAPARNGGALGSANGMGRGATWRHRS